MLGRRNLARNSPTTEFTLGANIHITQRSRWILERASKAVFASVLVATSEETQRIRSRRAVMYPSGPWALQMLRNGFRPFWKIWQSLVNRSPFHLSTFPLPRHWWLPYTVSLGDPPSILHEYPSTARFPMVGLLSRLCSHFLLHSRFLLHTHFLLHPGISLHSFAFAFLWPLPRCAFSVGNFIGSNLGTTLVVGFDTFPLSVSNFISIVFVILFTGELGNGIWPVCSSSVNGLSGDVLKGSVPAKGFSEVCECWGLRCFLKWVKSWRKAGMDATMMPIFCSRLVPGLAQWQARLEAFAQGISPSPYHIRNFVPYMVIRRFDHIIGNHTNK